jgi:hypothetical protein
MRLARPAPILAALIVSLALPALASAKPHPVMEHSISAAIDLHGSNGYSIELETLGHEIELWVEKGDFEGNGLGVSYRLNGRVSSDHIEANLGKLGHISVRFESPSGHTRTRTNRKHGCGSQRTIEESGTFRGVIEFDGEQGFTTVSTRHAKGGVVRSTTQRCGRDRARSRTMASRLAARSEEGSDDDLRAVHAVSDSNGHNLSFEAFRIGDAEPWGIHVFLEERRGRIEIDRFAEVRTGEESVSFVGPGVHPTSATVTPPEPFSGTATYTKAPPPGALPWLGSLSVALPGLGTVPLAGEGFKAVACHSADLYKFTGCMISVDLDP